MTLTRLHTYLACIIVTAAIFAAPNRSIAAEPSDTAKHAYNLAVIDAGGSISKTSKEVTQLTQLLTTLSRMTKLEPEQIADKATWVKEQLEKKKGFKISAFRLLTETYIALRDAPAGSLTFADALAGVAVILSNQ